MAVSARRRRHPHTPWARTAKAPPSCHPGVAPQCGTETAPARRALAGGYLRDVAGAVQALQRRLLTIQSDSAAPQPARGATTILGLPARGTRKARCRDAVRLSVGFSRGGGLSSARERAGPLPLRPLLPAPLQTPVLPGWEPRGRRSLPLPSVRLLPLAPGASEMPGGRIQTKKEREGEQRRGPTPPSLSREGKKKFTTGRGRRSEERGMQRQRESAGHGSAARGSAGERSPRRRAA